MDWHSWLSQTPLHPILVSEYALLLSRNELDAADIPHFDHPFLHTLGISIAKHRLEILKLAHKKHPPSSSSSLTRLLAAMRKTKYCLARYIHSLINHHPNTNTSAIMALPRPPRKAAPLLRRGRRGVLMITDGGQGARRSPLSHTTSPMMYSCSNGEGDEIRWDSMFQDLKPT